MDEFMPKPEIEENNKVEKDICASVSRVFFNELKTKVKNRVYTKIEKAESENYVLHIKISSYGVKWYDDIILVGNTLEKMSTDHDCIKSIVGMEIESFKKSLMSSFFY